MDAVRCFTKKNSQWDDHLPLITGALRASVNGQTGLTPDKMTLGREVNVPVDMNFPLYKENKDSKTQEQCAAKLFTKECKGEK